MVESAPPTLPAGGTFQSQRASPVTRPATWSALVSALPDETDEHRSQQRKHERLQERDEYLEQHDPERGEERRGCDEVAAEAEDEPEQREHHDVSGRHVREQPD